MGTLDQVKLLEAKVVKAIDFVKLVTEENSQIKERLESYQTRIRDLEIVVQEFKEDQGRIEEGILSALERLNQFEDAIEKSLSTLQAVDDLMVKDPGIVQGEDSQEHNESDGEGASDTDGNKNSDQPQDNSELDIF